MFANLIMEIWKDTPGLTNLLLTGVDGIVIEKKNEIEEDEYVAAEAANLIKECQRFGTEMGSGGLQFLTSQFENKILAIQMVTDEYFLLGLLEDAKHLGRIRYSFNLKSYEWYSAIA